MVIKWIKGELYFKDSEHDAWRHYSLHPLCQPELPFAEASRGYPTMQLLLSKGYRYE